MIRQILAILVGVLTYLLITHGISELSSYLDKHYLSIGESGPSWSGITLDIAQKLNFLVPGFITGWIVGRNGLLLGFITGFIGGTVYLLSLIFTHDISITLQTLIMFLGGGISEGLPNSAAGGAAELLRSNKSLQPTAKDAAG